MVQGVFNPAPPKIVPDSQGKTWPGLISLVQKGFLGSEGMILA